MRRESRPGWAYYGAITVFVAVLAFAVLGLVRSSTRAAASGPSAPAATPSPSPIRLATGPVTTPRIPPPSPIAPTQPPSRTYIHHPPEVEAMTPSEPLGQPRR